MIYNEILLCSVMGRSGSTYIRNLLGKLDENICLVTGKQLEILAQRSAGRNLCTIDLLEYISSDIKELFSDTRADLQAAANFFYKCPVSNLLSVSQIDTVKDLPAIIIDRHPVSVCASASKKEFLLQSRTLADTKEQMSAAAQTLGFQNIQEFESDLELYREDALMTSAVIFKYSYLLQKLFFTSFHNAPVMTIAFEYFLDQPEQIFRELLVFLAIAEIEKKLPLLNDPFYHNAIEEGGIQMSSLINKNKLSLINYDNTGLEEVYDYLHEICDEMGYSKKCDKFPDRISLKNS